MPSQGSKLWWSNVQNEWPLRLLHIPTMTSVERTGESTYGTDDKPEYSILTYTWGRFRAEWGSPALDVKGTTWKIPPIKESCFTVEAFQHVINFMGHDVEYAWVDVACIDQENREVKMYEVGRQVGIFKGAKRAYVWLHSFSNAELKSLHDTIIEYGPQIIHPSLREYGNLRTVMPILQESFDKLFSDPWFTSLWTLQESVLRRDATVLCREASPIQHPWNDDHDVYLAMLANTCRNIYLDLQGTLETTNMFREVKMAAQNLISRLEESGFHFLYTSNPNVQYGAARFRQTEFPLDRIYGIMQIYGITVGEAAEPGRTISTMEELEDQFAAALNARSAVLGQAFVHVGNPVSGKTWRITQTSRVHEAIMAFDQTTNTNCTIVRNSKDAAVTVNGPACSLQRLEALWEKLAWKVARDRYGAQVMLDHNGVVLSNVGKDLDESNFEYTIDNRSIVLGIPLNDYEACKCLISTIPSADLQVISLGKVVGDMRRSDYRETHLGLLIHRDSRDGLWRRIGICKWVVEPNLFLPFELALWSEMSIALY